MAGHLMPSTQRGIAAFSLAALAFGGYQACRHAWVRRKNNNNKKQQQQQKNSNKNNRKNKAKKQKQKQKTKLFMQLRVVVVVAKCYKSLVVDIDECADNTAGCSQICTNNGGSFTCSCRPGYLLGTNRKTCYGMSST